MKFNLSFFLLIHVQIFNNSSICHRRIIKKTLVINFFPSQRWRHYRVKCLMINLQQLNVFIVNERQFTVYILFILKMRTGQESVYTYSQLFFSLLRHTGTLLYQNTVWYNPTAIKFVHVCHMIMTKCPLTTVSLSIYINVYNILL